MTRIVVLAGEGEYESDTTMAPVSDRIARHLSADLVYRIPDVLDDVPDFPPSRFGDLTALDGADLLVLFTRFRTLPDQEMALIASYIDGGGAILALRTANHAFRQGGTGPWASWADQFADRVLGSAWSSHHGHTSTTLVTVTDHTGSITQGLPDSFPAESWLYVTDPPEDATILLRGDPLASETAARPSPVAWTRTLHGQRVFYTSLGSQKDLRDPLVQKLLENAADWCVGNGPA